MYHSEEYRAICQKNEKENYLIDKLIFRKISIYLTILFIKLGISANTTTFLSLAASLSSCFFLLHNTAPMMFAAALLVFLYYMLDHTDGELARYYIKKGLQKPSLRGHYFDLLVHRYSSNLMVFFMGISVYNLYGYEWVVLVGFAAFVGLSSFPNVIAAQVLIGKIANDPGVVKTAPAANLLQRMEKKEEQVKLVHGGPAAKVKKLIGEIFFFPGHILMIIAVLLADIVFKNGFELFGFAFNFRLLFVVFMAFLFVLKTIIQGYMWFARFKEIS